MIILTFRRSDNIQSSEYFMVVVDNRQSAMLAVLGLRAVFFILRFADLFEIDKVRSLLHYYKFKSCSRFNNAWFRVVSHSFANVW